MKEIPHITFLKKEKTDLEYEIFTFSNLFSRSEHLDFSLEKPHRVDFYHILYITKGRGTHILDFHPYHYREGSILFISKGQVHAFEVRPDVDGFIILFTEKFLSKNLIHSDILSFYRLYNYYLHSPMMHPDEIGHEKFISIISEMYEEYYSSDAFAKEDILRLLLKMLLLKAERIKRTLISDQRNAARFLQFGTFRNLIEKHFFETRNAEEYAGMMNISYKHLNEICKSIAGATAKKVIDQFIILEIKRSLSMSDVSIKELTYQLGFDEPTNLVKYFKKHTGQAPSQFKKNLIK